MTLNLLDISLHFRFGMDSKLAFEAQTQFYPFKPLAAASAMAVVRMLLSISVCVLEVLGEESCDTPARSAALLQSSVHRNEKSVEEPNVLSPAMLFGPGPMNRMRPGMGPHHMRPFMGAYPGMHRFPGNPGSVNFHASLQGRGESTYGSSYGGGSAGAELTPCQSASEWTPDKDFAGYCDTWGSGIMFTKETCATEGCEYQWGYCYCKTEAGCTTVGATWHPYTCRMQWESQGPDNMEKIKEAAVDGTCEGKDVYGYQVKDMVSYPAAECCKDYPSTMCEKDVQPMNPCLNQEDFLPDAYAYTSCDLSEVNPTKRQCEATPDCKEQWGWCECKTKSACELLGGNFYGGTCQEELKWWSPGDHKGVKEALEKHTCQGVKGSYEGDIKYRVDWLGHSCCLSKKSICEELDNYSSHYSGMY